MATSSISSEDYDATPPRARTFAQFLDRTFKYWAVLPLVAVLVLLSAYPVAQLFRMSVSTVSFEGGKVIWEFSGLENLYTFLDDHIFITAMRNTVLFVMVTVTAELFLGFVLALLASRVARFAGLYRTILIIPILVPPIAIGTVWRLMYNYDFGDFQPDSARTRTTSSDVDCRPGSGHDLRNSGRHLALGCLCLLAYAGRH